MKQRPGQVREETEQDSDAEDVASQQKADANDTVQEEDKPTASLDMLFREAEVIARNLKESGTRR
jgi:hypothetical protein